MKPFAYTACYCEENIWHLCVNPQVNASEKKVVWISSGAGVCPLWYQRAATSPDEPVWWDYHVVLLARADEWQVWDLDTTLALPVSATNYFARTFLNTVDIDPLFRVMDASYYQRCFSSDRSHMIDSNSQWLADPPAWQPIHPQAPTFYEMLDFSSSVHGDILSLEQMTRVVQTNSDHL